MSVHVPNVNGESSLTTEMEQMSISESYSLTEQNEMSAIWQQFQCRNGNKRLQYYQWDECFKMLSSFLSVIIWLEDLRYQSLDINNETYIHINAAILTYLFILYLYNTHKKSWDYLCMDQHFCFKSGCSICIVCLGWVMQIYLYNNDPISLCTLS